MPELRRLPNKLLFKPWSAGADDLRRAGLVLRGRPVSGRAPGAPSKSRKTLSYPQPIVPPGEGLARYRRALFALDDHTARAFEDFNGVRRLACLQVCVDTCLEWTLQNIVNCSVLVPGHTGPTSGYTGSIPSPRGSVACYAAS